MSVGEMSTLDSSGDTKSTWDSDNPAEVAAAKATFDELTKKGYSAFRVNKKGDQGELMREFDPNAEAVIMVPRMVGG